MVCLLPGSQDGFLISGPAYLLKFAIMLRSSGTSQPKSIR